MAAPRCTASFLRVAKRSRISNPRPFVVQSFSRCESSDANPPSDSKPVEPAKDVKPPTMEDVKPVEAVPEAVPEVASPVAAEAMPGWKNREELLERLKELQLEEADLGGENLEDLASVWESQQKAAQRAQAALPKTKKEAKEYWKELQKDPDHFNLLHMWKRGGIYPTKLAEERGIKLRDEKEPISQEIQQKVAALRDPVNLRAIHLRPLRRTAEHGIPVCDLQLRTYSIRNLLLFADVAMRAAYYLGLPAKGPVPLPRIVERWTVPRANFVFKKSQENFERITMRRLIQIQDGHPDVVKIWLAFLQKHQMHGVGMKANIYEFESMEDALKVGKPVKEGDVEGRREAAMLKKVEEILKGPVYRDAMKGFKSPAELRA